MWTVSIPPEHQLLLYCLQSPITPLRSAVADGIILPAGWLAEDDAAPFPPEHDKNKFTLEERAHEYLHTLLG